MVVYEHKPPSANGYVVSLMGVTIIPLTTLGIVVDADMVLEDRWKSLRDLFEESGYDNVSEHPSQTGTILQEDDRPTVGIWIMPDNIVPGMLEHFVRFLVPNDDTLWNRAGRSVDDIPISERLFRDTHIIKAHMHTWLAWQEDPGQPMGLPITKRFLDPDVPQAQLLITWVRTLFSL